jgi:CHAD domain-containing protein
LNQKKHHHEPLDPVVAEKRRQEPLQTWARESVEARLTRLEKELGRLVETPNPDTIHDARVAGRRLRATLRHVGSCLPPHEADKLRSEVGGVGRMLGEVRDLDILMENMAADARRPSSPFAGLVRRMQVQRERVLHRALPEALALRGRLPAWRGRLGV